MEFTFMPGGGASTVNTADTGGALTGKIAGAVTTSVGETINATSVTQIDRDGSTGLTSEAIANGAGLTTISFSGCTALASFSIDNATAVTSVVMHGKASTADIDALLLRFYIDALANVASANLTQTPAAPPSPSVPVLTGAPTGWDPITGVVWSFDGLSGANLTPSWVGKVGGTATYAIYNSAPDVWVLALYAEKDTPTGFIVGGYFVSPGATATEDYGNDGVICGGTLHVAVGQSPWSGEILKALIAGGTGTGWTSITTD